MVTDFVHNSSTNQFGRGSSGARLLVRVSRRLRIGPRGRPGRGESQHWRPMAASSWVRRLRAEAEVSVGEVTESTSSASRTLAEAWSSRLLRHAHPAWLVAFGRARRLTTCSGPSGEAGVRTEVRSASAAASVRLLRFSFIRMLLTWLPAVLVLHEQTLCDLGVGQTLGEKVQNLEFSSGQTSDSLGTDSPSFHPTIEAVHPPGLPDGPPLLFSNPAAAASDFIDCELGLTRARALRRDRGGHVRRRDAS